MVMHITLIFLSFFLHCTIKHPIFKKFSQTFSNTIEQYRTFFLKLVFYFSVDALEKKAVELARERRFLKL